MDNVFTKHPNYNNSTFERDFYEGGDSCTGEKYLFPLPFESANQRKRRNEKYIHWNFCSLIIDTFTALAVKREPRIDIGKKLPEQYKNNIDGKGTDLKEHMKESDRKSYVEGFCYLLVDQAPVPPGEIINRQDELEIYPKRIVRTSKENVIDWSKDEQGGFNWVKIYHESISDRDPLQERKTDKFVTIYTKTEIAQYIAVKGELEKESWVLVEGYPKPSPFAPLRKVPLFKVPSPNGKSIIRDTAKLNRRLNHQTSVIDLMHDKGSQIVPEILKDGGEWKDNGTEMVYYRDPKDPIGMRFISPVNPNTVDIREERQQTIETIQLLSSTKKSDARLVSGVAKAYEFLDQNSILAEKTASVSEAYQSALELLAWFHDNNTVNNLKSYSGVKIEFLINELTGYEVGNIVSAFADIIKPGMPVVVSREVIKAGILGHLQGKISNETESILREEIDRIPQKTFDSMFSGGSWGGDPQI